MAPPQSFISTYAPRLRGYLNSLLTPVIQPTTQNAPTSRTTKRGTVVINYSEDLLHDDDFDDSDNPRRLTGLRSRREDPTQIKETLVDRLGKELDAPIDVQGIWREWMGKPRFGKTDKQLHVQAALPLTLIPIRIDFNIPSFTPHPALPLPNDTQTFGINPSLPAYKTPDPTPPLRLKDVFLWNLHEALITPDQFALLLVHELDLPNSAGIAMEISQQIRQQLEEYAGVALHPLFHATNTTAMNGTTVQTIRSGTSRDQSATPALERNASFPSSNTNGIKSQQATIPTTPAAEAPTITPLPNGSISATAQPYIPTPSSPEDYSPDDTYRCIINLNINLLNKLFTDRFEWSLLHPPGMAELFARQTCADMGLAGEWVPAMAHAIYEAVLRLKKEACESGGLVGSIGYGVEHDNLSLEGQEAGWRFDHEGLADEWEPKIETLSKEEIEKREGDRERQIRRLRRETARFSSTANMIGGAPTPGGLSGPGGDRVALFDQQESAETPMGRGERSKKKRRFRSLSPLARGGTPADANAGYGGGDGRLTDWERQSWRCSHCLVHGSGAWAVRDGPAGPRTLCNNCGLLFERDKKLPQWSKDLHRLDVPLGAR
ncbi:Chromatin structure remodeling complex protein sfh1 [Agyrium rufum]|nr:Chromatin structure remodeling complex protein sfh1 [Agyrium rufum]